MCEEKKKDNSIWWKLGGVAMLILISCTIAYSCGCKTGKSEAQEKRIEQEAQAITQKPSEEAEQEQYWQSSSSGVIHNSSCRWYNNSAGRFVDYDAEGRDCKVCGGR
jgi:hypothetical protein